MFADVIIDIQHEKLDKIFQYRIPERLEHEVEAGMAVVVPFGKGNRKTKGYVTALSKTCDYDAVFENGSSYQRKRKYKGEKAAQTADRPGDGGKTASLLSGKESESEGASDGGAS